MSYKVPDSIDNFSLSNSEQNSFVSFSDTENSPPMASTVQDNDTVIAQPAGQVSSGSQPLQLLSPELWSLPYITFTPEILFAATQTDAKRVSELFASSTPSISQPSPRVSVPAITSYDGRPATLRSFCSQLVNQIQGEQFSSEMAKVRFAYQCLGPGALAKMRSSFRCLEDQSIAPEIETLDEFLTALKQRCQDPSLQDSATTKVENMRQGNMKFHEFITLFEDNMVDSIYAKVSKSNWKLMLERRLSSQLRSIMLSSSDVPDEYHAFVAFLRRKDAGLQEILASTTPPAISRPQFPSFSFPKQVASHIKTSTSDLPVSKGGSAMDLDVLSREKGLDGRLTAQAKSARKALGRCVWCNKPGHIAATCPLNSRNVTAATIEVAGSEEELKEKLQQ